MILRWFTQHRWALVGATVVLYLLRVLIDSWRAGDLSTASFVILGAVAAFELGCAWYLLRGFSQFRDDPVRIDFEERRALVRASKKRFG